MLPALFELTIPSSERPQANASDSAATGIGGYIIYFFYLSFVIAS
jgi:hypothetical protein